MKCEYAAGLALLLLAGCGDKPVASASATVAKAFPVEIEVAAKRAFPRVISATGSVDAYETITVTARVAGVVERVRVAEGQTVSAGESLAEIEPARYRLAVDSARAALQSAEARAAEARAGLKRRESASQAQAGIIAPEDLDASRARVDQATADVAGAKAALARAELDLGDSTVAAPIPGVIQVRQVRTGAYAQPGTPIATLVRRDPLQLRFPVPIEDAARLAAGTKARFTVAGLEKTFTASITLVAASADAATRLVQVVAQVDAGAELVRPGSFARVSIDLPTGELLLAVPDLAVRPSARGFLMFVIDGEGDAAVAHERKVETGPRATDGRIAIISGVTAGERIVVRGGQALRDGVKVALPVPAEKPAAAAQPADR